MPPAKPPLQVVATLPKRQKKPAKPVRRRADWAAIERDYRTGKFTLRELEAQHGASAGQISRKARQKQWTQDLTQVIKQATNHALLLENATQTQQEASERNTTGSGDAVLATVLAAAEMNKQVILRHRSEITGLRSVATRAIAMLERQLDAMLLAAEADVEEGKTKRAPDPSGLLLAAQRASQTMARLQVMERKAFGLDEEDDPASKDLGASRQNTLTPAARAARIAKLFQIAGQAAHAQPAATAQSDVRTA